MSVTEKDHVPDDVSIVSESTNITNVTQNLQTSDVCRNLEMYYSHSRMSLERERDVTKNTYGCEMSPLVPMQVTELTQMSPAIEDSESEVSEPLIPVISTKSSTTVKTKCYETQESQLPDDSQSLLPQLPVRSCLSSAPCDNGSVVDYTDKYRLVKGDNSSLISSQCTISRAVNSGTTENADTESRTLDESMVTEHTLNLNNCAEMTFQEMEVIKKRMTQPADLSATTVEQMDESQNLREHTLTSKKSNMLGVLQGQQNTARFKSKKLQNKHKKVGLAQRNVSLSQSVTVGNGRDVEISQSQGSVSLTSLEKDPVDRIISRLDRLASSLEKVPRRQMMVMEAAVLQCITSLQDSLNNKLKNLHSTVDATGILRKLLQTSQNGLMKLTEQHKLEKSQLAQTGTQSTQLTCMTQQNQSAVSDLEKRQKRVLSLLKRQKYLVEVYKTTKSCRPESGTDVTASQNSENKLHEDTKRRQSGSTCRNKRDIQEFGRTRQGKLYTCCYKGGDVLKKSVKTHMTKTLKESSERHLKSKMNVLKETLPQYVKGTGKGEKQGNNVNISQESDEDQFRPGQQNEEFENYIISQDVSTVTDTQEFNTQDTARASVRDSLIDGNNLATKRTSEDNLLEYTRKEHERFATVQATEGKNYTEVYVSVSSGKDKGENSKIINRENTSDTDRDVLKRDKGENVERNENVKKPKLNDDICVNVTSEKTIITTKKKTKMSELLWLNMLTCRDDIDKPVKNTEEKEKTTQQEFVTARKLNDVRELSCKRNESININRDKAVFPVVRPNFRSVKDVKEVENTFALPEGKKKRETSITIKTGKSDETIYYVTEKKREKVICKEINATVKEKSDQIIDCLSSPPNTTIPGETWHNVSPTATSMSSDVFMVKVKDLQKRMKRRAVLSAEKKRPQCTVMKNDDNKEVHIQWNKASDTNDITEKLVAVTEKIETGTGNPVKVNDTISVTIDSVIKQSREIKARGADDGPGELEKTWQNSTGATGSSSEMNHLDLQQKSQICTKSSGISMQPETLLLNDTINVRKGCNKQQRFTTWLQTLKNLVHSGQLTPGKATLSCYLKGKTHKASLTSFGKVRTQEGLVFATVSQWVSTLSDGEPVKKRKAYEMVLYKGRQLLSLCEETPDSAVMQRHPTTIQDSYFKPNCTRSSVDQAIQVKDLEFILPSSKMSGDEKRLNALLSTCVVRLLTERDFVSCNDLPDNFWTEDFSKVRLHKDIWDSVDAW